MPSKIYEYKTCCGVYGVTIQSILQSIHFWHKSWCVWVTIDWVWIANQIYWTLATYNYNEF
jgi:hypothetical protein